MLRFFQSVQLEALLEGPAPSVAADRQLARAVLRGLQLSLELRELWGSAAVLALLQHAVHSMPLLSDFWVVIYNSLRLTDS